MLSVFIHASFLALVGQGTPPPPDLAITGARIEIGNGNVIPSGTIVLHGGKIAAIGANVDVPQGATKVDAAGAVIYPGFIDAYCTDGLKLPSAPPAGTAPSNRDNAPATMWHGNRRGIRSDILAAKALDVKERIAINYAQGVTTALLAPGGGMVRGSAAVVSYVGDGVVLRPDAGEDLSFRGVASGGPGGGYPGTLFGITATLRQTLADAQFYAGQPKPATPDPIYENLKPLVTGQVPAIFAADTSREIDRASRVATEFNLRLIVQGAREAYRQIDLLKRQRAAVIVNVDTGIEPPLKPDGAIGATPVEVLQERHDLWAEKNANAKRLYEAGIPFAFCSGVGSIREYLSNVRRTIAAGLPRDVALKALTSQSAELLGVADRVGTLEPGKDANLVIMSGDFADEKSEVRSVVVAGQKTDLKKGGA